MKRAKRIAVELLELVFIDHVEADERVLGAIRQRNLEAERFEQLVPFERLDEGSAVFIADMQIAQLRRDLFHVRRRPAEFVEQPYAFAIGRNARVIHIDMDSGLVAFIHRAPNEERLDRHRQRPIGGIPFAAFEKQVFAVLETKQGKRIEPRAIVIPPKDDRVMDLDLPEFIRNDERGHRGIAELRASPGMHAQRGMVRIVEGLVIAHGQAIAPCAPRSVSAARNVSR